MRFLRTILLGCCALFAGGCSPSTLVKGLLPQAESQFAEAFIENVRAGRIDEALDKLSVEARVYNGHRDLAQMAEALHGGTVETIEPISFRSTSKKEAGKPSRQTTVTYHLHLSTGSFLITLSLVNHSGKIEVIGTQYNSIGSSPETTNRFTLAGKSTRHYLGLALALLIPAICVAALVDCIRAKPAVRWWWYVFVLFGFVGVSLNWTSGVMHFRPFSFNLLGASVLKNGLFGPWEIVASIPIGAIAFYIRQRFLRPPLKAEATTEPPLL